jgi:peroxiredoxin
MRLEAPCKEIDFRTKDVFGEHFQLSDFVGRRVVLSFFRDAACPFCNYRIYELTQQYDKWKNSGLEIVTVFSDTSEQVRKHVAKRPRPFTMISDAKLNLYDHYGVEQSATALFKALIFRLPEIIKGLAKGGRPTNNPHIKIVPADFLIDIDGRISEVWYGKNTADHIPMERLEKFASAEEIMSRREMEDELQRLRNENEQLRSPD